MSKNVYRVIKVHHVPFDGKIQVHIHRYNTQTRMLTSTWKTSDPKVRRIITDMLDAGDLIVTKTDLTDPLYGVTLTIHERDRAIFRLPYLKSLYAMLRSFALD